jgi:hypothetical protein
MSNLIREVTCKSSIWDIFGSNIGMDSGCLMQVLCGFTLHIQTNAGMDHHLATTPVI